MNLATNSRKNVAAVFGLMFLSAAAPLHAQTTISVTANSLSFAHHGGMQTPPPAQTVRVFSNQASTPFSAQAATESGGAWLTVNNAFVTTGTTGASSQDVQIGINPANLPPNTYNGTVVVSASGGISTTINVRLIVHASPQLVPSPSSLTISGTPNAIALTPVTVNSTGGAIQYSANASCSTPANCSWLSVSQPSTASGGPITVVTNASGLTAGTFVGAVTLTPLTGTGGPVTIPVNLVIAAAVTLRVNPTSTTIGVQLGQAAIQSRTITVTSSDPNTPAGYTARTAAGAPSWLSLSNTSTPSGTTTVQNTTPNPFFAIVNPTGLVAGTYNGQIEVVAVNGSGTQMVTVNLVVSASPVMNSIPESFVFNHTLGGVVPTPQQLSISSTSGAFQFQAVAATQTGGDWLAVTPQGTTNLTPVSVQLNATRVAQLTAGTYTGTITITVAGQQVANSPLTIPVTLNVTGSTLLNVAPQQLNFTLQQGQTPSAQTLTVTSTDASSQPFTVAVDPASVNWLLVSAPLLNTGPLGAPVTVNINSTSPAIAQPGVYDATIVITPTSIQNAVPIRVPVKLNVIGGSVLTATPAKLDFTQPGTAAPAAQTVTLSGVIAGITFQAQPSATWITVDPVVGTTSAAGTQLRIGINATGLTAGQAYEGNVAVVVSNVGTVNIPVTLQFRTGAALTLAPAQLNFTAVTGAPAPAAQNIAITSGGPALAFTAAATVETGGNWLSVAPASGTTTASGGAATNVAVTVNPTGLALGTYNGTVTIRSDNASNSPQTVPVRLVVSNPSPPAISSIENAATNVASAAAPGLIMAIKGTNLGPATDTYAVVENNAVTTRLAEVRVLFDNVEAPILFANARQVNIVAPYVLATRTSTRVVLEYRGVRSEPIDLRVVETAPGMFTMDSTGRGQGAFLNQNNSVNGPTNPAPLGSIIVLYATGEGQVIPAGSDGRVITANDLRRPSAAVRVRIGGQDAEVLYSGSAPGLVSGALQVNARIPQNLQVTGTQAVPVELIIGNATSTTQQNVTLTARPQ